MIISTQFQHHSNPKCWTEEEDQKVRNAITLYETKTLQQFPKDPFSGSLPFSLLKNDYLKDLDKSGKQIRERWVTHLCSKLKSFSILEEDHGLVLSLNEKHPKQWARIAKEIYEIFEKSYYYSDNSIKNFCNQNKNRKKNRNQFIQSNSDICSDEGVLDLNSKPENKRRKTNRKEEAQYFPHTGTSCASVITESQQNHISTPFLPASQPSSLTSYQISHATNALPQRAQNPMQRQVSFSNPDTVAVHYEGAPLDVQKFGYFDQAESYVDKESSLEELPSLPTNPEELNEWLNELLWESK